MKTKELISNFIKDNYLKQTIVSLPEFIYNVMVYGQKNNIYRTMETIAREFRKMRENAEILDYNPFGITIISKVHKIKVNNNEFVVAKRFSSKKYDKIIIKNFINNSY